MGSGSGLGEKICHFFTGKTKGPTQAFDTCIDFTQKRAIVVSVRARACVWACSKGVRMEMRRVQPRKPKSGKRENK